MSKRALPLPCLLSLLFSFLLADPRGVAQTEGELSHTLAQLDEVRWSDWEELSDLLTDIHRRTGIPALAAAFVDDGRIVAHATVGVREFGSEVAVAATDPFHLGSITKSFSATVIGKLVEQGRLTWGTKVRDVLGELEMHAAYGDVTLEELLQHRGGLHAYTDGPPPGMSELGPLRGTSTEKRAAFLAAALSIPPAGAVGEAPLYSNAGYTLAGHMAERVAGASWEELVTRHVFEPLQMKSAGFGIPPYPLGHAGNGPVFHPVSLEAYPTLERIAPAGNVHACVSDLARYARAHLAGLGGRDDLLRSETVKRLHTASGPPGAGYASGWRIGTAPSGESAHWHGGTVGASYAEVRLYPASLSGVIVLTTVPSGLGETIAGSLVRALLERYRPQVSGFVTAKRGAQGVEIIEQELAEGDDARFWRVVEALSKAINDEDREAYRALFSPGYSAESRDSLFDFMAQNVLPQRGGIHAFHDPSAPFRIGDSEETTRVVNFHLENGFPGYLGISLDADEKLIELSLFVKSDLCPNGTDRRCKKITRKLQEGS